MIQAPFLQPGNTVAIIAPARKLDEDVVHKAKGILESWGLRVVLGDYLFTNEHSYLSASDEHRRISFQQMLDMGSIRAIFCARGGYGSTRILDQLNFDLLQQKPKWIIGFSDITSIHLQLTKLGIQSIHGTMPVLFSSEEQKMSVDTLQALLFGKESMLSASADAFNRLGEAHGQLIGGNLSLLVDSLGTQTELISKGKILLIEEVGEYYYKVDRMIVQLKRSGKLAELAGLVVGHFTDITESTLAFGESVKQILVNHTSEYAYPIGFNFPIGHAQPNLPFIQGRMSKLLVTDQWSTLSYVNDRTSA